MNYFIFFGFLYLLKLTIEDLKNKMWVDDRLNYFMIGVVATMIFTYDRSIGYILTLIAVNLLLMFFIDKRKLMGEADTKTILWSFTGYGMINPVLLMIYVIVFIFCIVVSCITTKLLKKKLIKFPAYPSFFISFIVTFIVAYTIGYNL